MAVLGQSHHKVFFNHRCQFTPPMQGSCNRPSPDRPFVHAFQTMPFEHRRLPRRLLCMCPPSPSSRKGQPTLVRRAQNPPLPVQTIVLHLTLGANLREQASAVAMRAIILGWIPLMSLVAHRPRQCTLEHHRSDIAGGTYDRLVVTRKQSSTQLSMLPLKLHMTTATSLWTMMNTVTESLVRKL
jgi:hypothetical protein